MMPMFLEGLPLRGRKWWFLRCVSQTYSMECQNSKARRQLITVDWSYFLYHTTLKSIKLCQNYRFDLNYDTTLKMSSFLMMKSPPCVKLSFSSNWFIQFLIWITLFSCTVIGFYYVFYSGSLESATVKFPPCIANYSSQLSYLCTSG